MSKSKRKPVADIPADKNASSRAPADVPDPISGIVRILVVALVVVRWLIPTESTPEGETLWIVQLWLGVALLWVWSCLRSRKFHVRWNAFDVALWILVLGHAVSTAAVFV